MGRKTWESLPEQSRPLPNRQNVILTRSTSYEPTFQQKVGTPKPLVYPNLGGALEAMAKKPEVSETFVIGGQALFEEALSKDLAPHCKLIFGTRINRDYEADVFMPTFEDRFEPLFISQTYS